MRTRRHAYHISPVRSIQFINHENAVVLDLRSPDSYRKGHIIEAISMATKEIKENPKKLVKFQTRPLIIVDENGNEAQKIATMLLKQGYNAYSLAGGIRAWNEAQLPLIKE
jgi:rhodanese-related sulfurtransferase